MTVVLGAGWWYEKFDVSDYAAIDLTGSSRDTAD